MQRKKILLLYFVSVVACFCQPMAFDITLSSDKVIYDCGEPVKFDVNIVGDPADSAMPQEFYYRLWVNGFATDRKSTELANLPAGLEFTFDKSSWVVLEISCGEKSRKLGVLVDPENFPVVAPEPIDFDVFWARQRAELNALPMEVKMTSAGELLIGNELIKRYDVQINCVGNAPVSGYLMIPERANSQALPLLVSFQGYGYYSAWSSPFDGANSICFSVNAHGIENGREPQYYEDLTREHGGYLHYGETDKDEFYFKNMYIRVMRALEFAKSIPQWDGRNLVVFGDSQGGGQAIAGAALDKDVTLLLAMIPAMGDRGGIQAQRMNGWPRLYEPGDTSERARAIFETLGYFDNNYFAKRIHCEVKVSTGLLDFTSPPSSVYTFYNSLPAGVVKEIHVDADRAHEAPADWSFFTPVYRY